MKLKILNSGHGAGEARHTTISMPVHEVPHVSTRPDMSFFTKKEIQRGAEFILKSWLPYICTGWSIHLVVAYFVDAKLKVPMPTLGERSYAHTITSIPQKRRPG